MRGYGGGEAILGDAAEPLEIFGQVAKEQLKWRRYFLWNGRHFKIIKIIRRATHFYPVGADVSNRELIFL